MPNVHASSLAISRRCSRALATSSSARSRPCLLPLSRSFLPRVRALFSCTSPRFSPVLSRDLLPYFRALFSYTLAPPSPALRAISPATRFRAFSASL
eukprot:5442028-Pleurochrysis_carterae.AAC.1